MSKIESVSSVLDRVMTPPPAAPALHFNLNWQEPPAMPDAVRAMHDAAQSILCRMAAGHQATWLTFIGQSGCGKTHLAKAIRAVARDQLFMRAQWWSVASIADKLRAGEYGLLDWLAELDFLALDDLGAEYSTDFSRAKLTHLMDRREHKWTVITSNLSLKEIGDTMDCRVSSRINRNGVVIDVKEPWDYCLAINKHGNSL